MNKYYKYIPVVLTLGAIIFIVFSGYEFDTSPMRGREGGGALFLMIIFGIIYSYTIIKAELLTRKNKRE